MALVLLRRFPTSMEATIARSHLKAAGIEGFILGAENEWNTFYRIEEPVRLMVVEEELVQAAAILAAVPGKG